MARSDSEKIGASRVWLGYDLGVDGDYSGLYGWLDRMKAVECGDSFASIKLSGSYTTAKLVREIRRACQLRSRDRLYLVYQDAQSRVWRGAFIFGKRRRAPWDGFAGVTIEGDPTDEAE